MRDEPEPGVACDNDDSAASFATVNTKHDDELQCHLPEGSVYILAAMLDGAGTSDPIVGWIFLLVSAPSCCRYLDKRYYTPGQESRIYMMAVTNNEDKRRKHVLSVASITLSSGYGKGSAVNQTMLVSLGVSPDFIFV